MKLLFDFLPVLLFFAAYKLADIYVATGVAIAAAIVQIVWSLARREKVKPIQWISLGFILIFGTATILLQDEFYIKVKWTLFYGLMGLLILGAVAFGKNPLKSVLGNEIELPPEAWQKLKVFGGTALSVVFVFIQAFWLAKYLPDEADEPPKDSAIKVKEV